jgi:hypothetical protein
MNCESNLNQDLHHALCASGKEGQHIQAHGFRISQHDIHILDGFTGNTLDQTNHGWAVGARQNRMSLIPEEEVPDGRERRYDPDRPGRFASARFPGR